MTKFKVVTFTKNDNQIPVDLADTTKVKKLKAEGWEPVSERIMKKGDQVVTVKNDVQQAAFERYGFVVQEEQTPKL